MITDTKPVNTPSKWGSIRDKLRESIKARKENEPTNNDFEEQNTKMMIAQSLCLQEAAASMENLKNHGNNKQTLRSLGIGEN